MLKNFLKIDWSYQVTDSRSIQTLSKINKENHIQVYLTKTVKNQTFKENLKANGGKNVITLNSSQKTLK